MCSIPDPEKCLELLRKSGCSDPVIKHCMAVRDVALRIAKKAHADVKLVEAGALLHDIGRSKTHGIRHGVIGAKIAMDLGLSKNIVNIIERHLIAGIPEDTAEKLGLPPKDYMPQTLEEKIIAHADNLIDKHKKKPIEKEIKKLQKEGFGQHTERIMRLHKELSDICGMNLNEI